MGGLSLLAALAAAQAFAAGGISGKVAETIDSGGTTYVRVQREKDSKWVAVPQMTLEPGRKAAFAPGTTMFDFYSRTLKRTFREIVFSPGLEGARRRRGAAAAKKAGASVEKAKGADAYAVEQASASFKR